MPEVQDTAEADTDRPKPGPGTDPGRAEPDGGPDDAGDTDRSDDSDASGHSDDARAKAAEESIEEQEYVDRDKIDFDPDDGLYTGTAVDGGTKIPGPHDQVDDVEPGDEDDETIADE